MADHTEPDVVIGSNRLWCPETCNGIIAVSADLVVAAGHSHLFAWRLPGGELVATWPRHRILFDADAMEVSGDDVRFEAAGRRIVVSLATGALRDDGPGKPWSGKHPHYGPIQCAEWIARGDLGASRISMVDRATGRDLCADEPAFTPDEVAVAAGRLVAGAPGGAGVWDLATGRRTGLLHALRSKLRAFGDVVAATTPDGVARWDPLTGEVLAKVPLPGLVQSGSFDRAGRRFVATLYRLPGGLRLEEVADVFIADLDTGRVDVIEAPEDATRSAAMSPAGDRVAVCDEDGMRIHALAPGFAVLERALGGHNVAMWFSPDGRRVLAAKDDVTWFMGAGRIEVPGAIHCWLDDGLLVAEGAHVRIVEPDTREVRAAWTFPAVVEAASLDGEHLAVATNDGSLRIRRVERPNADLRESVPATR